MIEEYEYGKIIIDGKEYNHDVEVRWTGEVLLWPRKESHVIEAKDFARTIDENPEVVVIGTGEDGNAEVLPEAVEVLGTRGIKVLIDKTNEAVKTFNVRLEDSLEEEGRQEKIIGLFHITC